MRNVTSVRLNKDLQIRIHSIGPDSSREVIVGFSRLMAAKLGHALLELAGAEEKNVTRGYGDAITFPAFDDTPWEPKKGPGPVVRIFSKRRR